MLHHFITLFAALTAASAQICCVPDQWEGVQGNLLTYASVSGTTPPKVVSTSYLMSYDGVNKRVATIESLAADNYTVSAGIILDYAADVKVKKQLSFTPYSVSTGVQYTVKDASCVRTTLGSWVKSCVPTGATNLGNTTYGAVTPLEVTTYNYQEGVFDVYLTVTADTCVPVQEVLYGSYADNYYMQSIGYSSITPGIKDPQTFSPPAFCAQAPLIKADMPVVP